MLVTMFANQIHDDAKQHGKTRPKPDGSVRARDGGRASPSFFLFCGLLLRRLYACVGLGRPARPVRDVQGCQIVIIEFQATNFITTLQIILKPSSIAPPYAVDIRSIRTTADAATRLEI